MSASRTTDSAHYESDQKDRGGSGARRAERDMFLARKWLESYLPAGLKAKKTFQDTADFDKVREDDRVDIVGLSELTPGKPVEVVLKHSDESEDRFMCDHSLTADQIEWFKAGSALNVLRNKG